jgi:CheY-like chemotaxis protein
MDEEAAAMDSGGILSGCHVLVVEDDYFIMDDLRHGLERHGATVLGPASNVATALDIAGATQRIDAAVLDINLQGEMAFAVADALRARGVPIVFATGYDRGILPAADCRTIHCQKPVDPEAVARALAACAMRRADEAVPG